MTLVAPVARALAGLGRRGSEALAASVFVGIALPPLASLAKPVFAETLFVLLVLSFLRVDPVALRRHATRPARVITAVAWIMLVVPLVAGGALTLAGGAQTMSGLYAALTLQAMAPPLVSAPALAALMGLDAALSLATLIACLAVAPATATVFAALFLGDAFRLTPLALGGKTLVLIAGAAIVAAAVRRLAGDETIARQGERIDGLNVVMLFLFAVGFMDGVSAHASAAPLVAIGLVALAFAVSISLGVMTFLVFAHTGRSNALALAVTGALRNLGLMAAAGGNAVPELAWLYFAYAQLPIYLMPLLAKPVVWRIGARHEG
jgi:hypothetical protein